MTLTTASLHLATLLFSLLFFRLLAEQAAPIYINVGGPDFQDDSGILWQSDTSLGIQSGLTSSTTSDIANTDNPTLYQTKRRDHKSAPNLQYDIPLSRNGGAYTVIVHFCETRSPVEEQGQRVFDVYMEDVLVFEKVDVYKAAGDVTNTAVVMNSTVAVNDDDDILSIDFRRKVFNVIVSGIEIHPLSIMVEDQWIDLDENEKYTGRHECSFVRAGDNFYLFGGRENPNALEIYSYNTNTWTQGATVPHPLNHAQAIEYEGLIWVIGAFETNSFPNETPAEHVYVYDPANDVWMQGPSIPRPRGAGGVAVHKGKIYLLGGNTIGHNGGFVSWFDEFNPQTGQWNTLTDAPHERDHFHATVVNKKLYAAGGRRTAPDVSYIGDTVAAVDVYDFELGMWQSSALPDDLPVPRGGTATAVLDDNIMVMGGESLLQEAAHSDVHSLDPTTGRWSTLASLLHGRHGMQAIQSGSGVYVVAGSPRAGGGNQKNMEVYNQNAPQGQPSVAGSLSATVVSVRNGDNGPQQQLVTIRHFSSSSSSSNTATQGVFVTWMQLSGPNSASYELIGGHVPPYVIPMGASVSVIVQEANQQRQQHQNTPTNIDNNNNDKHSIDGTGTTMAIGSGATATWLAIQHSGNQWLNITLVGA